MDIGLFDFELPPSLVAIYPPKERDDARLLVSMHAEECIDANIRDLGDWVFEDDLLIFNDTKVWKARLMGQRLSGGKISLLVTKIRDQKFFQALIQSSKLVREQEHIELYDSKNPSQRYPIRVANRLESGEYTLELLSPSFISVEHCLESIGTIPIPPYFKRDAEPIDEVRYQTSFAHHAGSVAASTAGLHFSSSLLDRLTAKGVKFAFVTLHIGLGTFQPVRVQEIEAHQMHQESYWVPQETLQAIERCRRRQARVIAVGTTVLRALESSALQGPYGETSLFIRPGFKFKMVDALLTNFHLPKSSLLILIAAFLGVERFQSLYAHAIEQKYRFLSYGDAMFLKAP